MIDVNWDLAPEGAEALEQNATLVAWCKDGYWWQLKKGWTEKFFPDNWQVIATRPTQTKTVADVVEQEGEKWTHKDGVSDCRIIHTDGDFSWVNYKSGEKYVVHNSCLKPIKPTISKAEAWDKLKDLPANEWSIHSHVMEIENKYDII